MANKADLSDQSMTTDEELEAYLDTFTFRDEDDWLAPPPSGAGFYIYCPIRFLAYLKRFGPEPGDGTPPEMPDYTNKISRGEDSTYFARGRVSGRIKIGRSRMPEYRVSQLQHCTNGEGADLLVAIPVDLEKSYHRVFSRWHEGHEWFAPHPDILAEIERLTPTR